MAPFSFTFQDFLDTNRRPRHIRDLHGRRHGDLHPVDPNKVGQSAPSNTIIFDIDNSTPVTVSNLSLNPADDTGIVGDNVTTDRTPNFVGTTMAGYTVELFVNGQPAVQNTATADASGTLLDPACPST